MILGSYRMSVGSANVPLAIVSGVICLAVGLGAGAAAMMGFGYKPTGPPKYDTVMGAGMPTAIPMGMPPSGASGKAKGGAGGGTGSRGPSNKSQLTALVTKLDQLTQKPLTLELTADQKKKAHELRKGLAEVEELSEDAPQKRFEDLLELLRDKKATREAAGFRCPAPPPMGRPPEMPNPFKDAVNAKHVKSLES